MSSVPMLSLTVPTKADIFKTFPFKKGEDCEVITFKKVMIVCKWMFDYQHELGPEYVEAFKLNPELVDLAFGIVDQEYKDFWDHTITTHPNPPPPTPREKVRSIFSSCFSQWC